MARSLFPSLETLESRIAPAALVINNPLPNIIAGLGKTGATVDLDNMFDTASSSEYDTMVTFSIKYTGAGQQAAADLDTVTIELFDTLTPLTVQNFLSYINNPVTAENFLGTFFHRSVSNFVLQGGGFDASNPAVHIPVGPTVENEFDPSNPQLSNVAGTVAMAKTAQGPNSATSEFFFNLADNSENLDNQNGGFTVFGKVVGSGVDANGNPTGMTLVNDIAALPTTANLQAKNSALTDVPYQGTLPTNGIPSASNLLTITGVTVTPPTHHGAGSGDTFSVSVTNPATGALTDLVSASVTGSPADMLQLHYKSGAAGVAEVTVLATASNGDSVSESFLVTVEPNLITNSVSDTLHQIIVPGDTGKVKFELTNNAAATAIGKVTVNAYLAPIDPTSPNPVVLDPSTAILIGSFTESVNIASGASAPFAGNVKVPISSAATLSSFGANGAGYQLIEEVTGLTGTDGTATPELFSNDKASVDGTQHAYDNIFGSFSAGTDSSGHAIQPRIDVPLKYVDAKGDLVTISYTGDGAGLLIPNSDGTFSIETGYLGLSGNSHTSVLSIKIQKGPEAGASAVTSATHTDIADITTLDPVGKISLGNVDVTGNLSVNEGAGSITLGNLLGDGVNSFAFTLDGSTTSTAVKVGNVANYNFTADSPLKSITATQWIDNNATAGTISVPRLSSLSIAGELEANVTVSAAVGGATMALKSFVVKGALEDSTVTIGGSVGSVSLQSMDGSQFSVGTATPSPGTTVTSFTVSGLAHDSTVLMAANVGSVTLGAMDTSNFLVGVSGSTVPAKRSDFAEFYTVNSFVIKGIAGTAEDMIASNVAAATFKSISVANVDSGSEASSFGFVADSIAKYVREQAGAIAKRLSNPAAGTVSDADGKYSVDILPLT